MIPKLSRGHSFQGLTRYLLHDRREPGQSEADTAERVGFTHTMNFAAGRDAGDSAKAARLMALTWQSREQLKREAGIKPGGSVSKAPPVWHSSLSWAKSERPDEAEMMRAVRSYLDHAGLGIEKGYQTSIVQHTDTLHPHVHIVVNLVHPDTGKQADPFRDRQKAQAWARDYERERGAVFCHAREAKHAAADQVRASHATPTRAAFNDRAHGAPTRTATDQAATPAAPAGRAAPASRRPARTLPYPAWKAQQEARNQAERAAADRTKAELGERYGSMRTRHDAAYGKRQDEIAENRTEREIGRSAIYEKYRTALDAVWNPQATPVGSGPDRSPWAKVAQHLTTRQAAFDRREGSVLGRLQNAVMLTGSGSVFRAARLALDPAERRRTFERQQRAEKARVMPRSPNRLKAAPQPWTAEPRRVQAERLKVMRTAELAEFDRRHTAGTASMTARHQFQKEGEQVQRDTFKTESRAAWAQHRQAFARDQDDDRTVTPAQATERKPDQYGRNRDRQPRQAANDLRQTGNGAAVPSAEVESAAQAAEPQQEAKADRFGRSRERKPRQPRHDREQATASPENSAVERVEVSGADHAAELPGATQAQDTGQGVRVSGRKPWTPEERAAKIAAEEARQAARQTERGLGGEDRGREMTR